MIPFTQSYIAPSDFHELFPVNQALKISILSTQLDLPHHILMSATYLFGQDNVMISRLQYKDERDDKIHTTQTNLFYSSLVALWLFYSGQCASVKIHNIWKQFKEQG